MSKSNRSNKSRESNKELSKKELDFTAYDITAETAETAILLLESQESEILCRTLRAITKFTEHEVQNRQALFDLKVLKYLLPHIDHAELNVRRYALKALAQICQLPQSPYEMLKDSKNLNKIASMLVQDEDLFVLEFVSKILAELTREPLGCDQMIAANILDTIFYRMRTCVDPDVQYNCTQILSNLISDPGTATAVTGSQHFSWPPLLALLRSQYIQIQQLALTTIDQLVCRHKDQLVQESFRDSTGIQDLCDLIESYEFRDIHIPVLQVLRDYAAGESSAAHVYRSGCLQRLLKYLDEALPAAKPPCLAVLTRLSYTAKGRDALHETGTDVMFCEQLRGDDAALLADAALGVANMAQLLPAANAMMDTNVIETLFGIIYDDAMEWFNIRINCLLAVSEMCRVLPAATECATEPTLFTILKNINRNFEYNPVEAQRLAVQCFDNMQEYESGRRAMLNADFIKELLGILERPDVRLKMLTCSVLSGLLRDDVARRMFTRCHGEKVVNDNLRIEHVGLRAALCAVVCAGVTHTTTSADVYLALGTVHYLFCNKKARYAIPAWESALAAILDRHLSAKFAYMNKLDIHENTRDGFYVLKRPTKPFPTLLSLMSNSSRLHPVFVASFGDPVTTQDTQTRTDEDEDSAPVSVPRDDNLNNYVGRLRAMFPMYREPNNARKQFGACDIVSSSLLLRARVLGVFVAAATCGVTQDMDCSVPSVDLHLAELMMALDSCVINLGYVKCGGALERAVLYKVLADRIALPCALCRVAERAWCEVAVPDVDVAESMQDHLYPGGLLRANYVVDLTDEPGSLHPPHSDNARRIRGY
ncbi:uncharacterized protein LOC121730414 [Aricia agestis]|uniref:uncharacterized protein LOC121730414 n=1 Tax=Aricia agestis TaxID=91739 RepID=UPI001C203D68|nr:uncharacterized protein LOC121730414 [Aricia agestis]